METRERIIRQYIAAYNAFDIDSMLLHLDEEIFFTNISNGETNMTLHGLADFKAQAEDAKIMFSQRTQTVTSFQHGPEATEAEIDYHGVLAMDLPNGLKKGDALQLKGKSIFRLAGEKITHLTDIS